MNRSTSILKSPSKRVPSGDLKKTVEYIIDHRKMSENITNKFRAKKQIFTDIDKFSKSFGNKFRPEDLKKVLNHSQNKGILKKSQADSVSAYLTTGKALKPAVALKTQTLKETPKKEAKYQEIQKFRKALNERMNESKTKKSKIKAEISESKAQQGETDKINSDKNEELNDDTRAFNVSAKGIKITSGGKTHTAAPIKSLNYNLSGIDPRFNLSKDRNSQFGGIMNRPELDLNLKNGGVKQEISHELHNDKTPNKIQNQESDWNLENKLKAYGVNSESATNEKSDFKKNDSFG